MKWLPASGSERVRVGVLAALLVVTIALVWSRQSGGPPPGLVTGPTGPVQPASNAPGGRVPGATATAGSQLPVPLNLSRVEQRDGAPAISRNLFRFGARPAPPLPPAPSRPMVIPPPPTPAGPPPIPLRLTGLMADPYGRPRAYLKDPASGAVFEVVEGQVVDGRYRVVKIGVQSVVVSYLDGSGQRTIPLGG
jgi:hypothetical protein